LYRRATPVVLIAAVLALALAMVWTTIRPAHAQVAVELPVSVITATTNDLAGRTGMDASSFGVARATNVQWNDASLGLPQPGESYAQFIVDGWVVWLAEAAEHDDVPTELSRYHTNGDGSLVLFAEAVSNPKGAFAEPLPDGAVQIVTFGGSDPDPVPISAIADPGTADELLSLLAAEGFGDVQIRELASMRPWIEGSFSPHYVVGGSVFEIFELAGPSAVDAALEAFSVEQERDGVALIDAAIWTTSALVVIQLDASTNRRMIDVMSTIIGPPQIILAAARPQPLPEPSTDTLTVADFESSLAASGLDVTRADVAVRLPWIPATGVVFNVDGATAEVFQTASSAEADAAIASLFADDAEAAPPANVTGWINGATIVLLRNAPDHTLVELAITNLMGSPRLATIAGGLPPLQLPPEDAPPTALPATGNGNVGDENGTPDWVWGVVAAISGGAILTAIGYRLWLQRRTDGERPASQ
jgi:hypothetical protein